MKKRVRVISRIAVMLVLVLISAIFLPKASHAEEELKVKVLYDKDNYVAKVSWNAITGAEYYEVRLRTRNTTDPDRFFQILYAKAVEGGSTSCEFPTSYFKYNDTGVSNTYCVEVTAVDKNKKTITVGTSKVFETDMKVWLEPTISKCTSDGEVIWKKAETGPDYEVTLNVILPNGTEQKVVTVTRNAGDYPKYNFYDELEDGKNYVISVQAVSPSGGPVKKNSKKVYSKQFTFDENAPSESENTDFNIKISLKKYAATASWDEITGASYYMVSMLCQQAEDHMKYYVVGGPVKCDAKTLTYTFDPSYAAKYDTNYSDIYEIWIDAYDKNKKYMLTGYSVAFDTGIAQWPNLREVRLDETGLVSWDKVVGDPRYNLFVYQKSPQNKLSLILNTSITGKTSVDLSDMMIVGYKYQVGIFLNSPEGAELKKKSGKVWSEWVEYTGEKPCEHVYILKKDTATCEKDGKKTYVCQLCQDTYSIDSKALGHNPTAKIELDKEHHGTKCKRCRKVLTSEGHLWKTESTILVKKCSTERTTYKCEACGAKLTEDKKLDSPQHEYDINMGVFTDADYHWCYCVNCGEKMIEKHSWYTQDGNDVCQFHGSIHTRKSEQGVIALPSDICGHTTITPKVQVTGNLLTEWNNLNGISDVYWFFGESDNHSNDVEILSAPGCPGNTSDWRQITLDQLQNAMRVYEQNTGKKIISYAMGNQYRITLQITLIEDDGYLGKKLGEFKSSANFYPVQLEDGYAATCSGDGEQDHYCCLICKKLWSTGGGEIASADIKCTNEHVYDDECDSVCNSCGASRTAPHKFGTNIKYDEEKHWKECEKCGIQQDISAHEFDTVVDIAKTCTEDGKSHEKCKVCGYKTESVVTASGHVWKGVEVVKEVTCTEDGEIRYECDLCGETTVFTLTSSGHQWTFVPEVPADCMTEGTAAHYLCENCGALRTGADEEDQCTEQDLVLPIDPISHHEGIQYSFDDDEHWGYCEFCQKESTPHEAHEFDGDTCTVCGFDQVLQAEWKSDKKKDKKTDNPTKDGETKGDDPVTPDDGNNSQSSSLWWLWVLMAVIVIALIVLFVTKAALQKKQKESSGSTDKQE